jgi:hypothetical protein
VDDDGARYVLDGQEYNYDKLCEHLESEAAELDPDEAGWSGGEFDVHDYIVDALLVGSSSNGSTTRTKTMPETRQHIRCPRM